MVRGEFFHPQKVIYGKATSATGKRTRKFFHPQKVIYGKAEIINPLISKEKQWNQAVGGRGGLAKGRRIFVVSKSGNLFVCRMPFFRAIIKRKVAILALSIHQGAAGCRTS